jgi:LysM repeat protein
MNRVGLSLLAVGLSATPVAVACGDDEGADATLPAIVTTTSSTIDPSTTIAVRQIYVVQSGDFLGNIADTFGVDMDELMAVNGIDNPNKIFPGQELSIPPSTAPVVVLTIPSS